MLLNLKIDHYLLINNCQINIKPGLSIITGSTGSGKSILIEAIALLIGERFNSNKMLENDIYIEGIFILNKNNLSYNIALDNGFNPNEEIVLSRLINKNTLKSTFRINGQWVNASIVKSIFENEIDIHSQFQTHHLFNNNYQQYLFDKMIKNQNLLKDTNDLYSQYLELKEELNSIEKNHLNQAKLLILKNQFEEINNSLDSLNNYDNLSEQLKSLEKYLDSTNIDNEIKNWILENKNTLENFSIKTNNKNYQNLLENILNDINNLEHIIECIDIDDINYQIDNINNQLFDINKLLRKYKMSKQELIDYHQELLSIINDNDNYEILLIEKKKQLDYKYNQFLTIATNLSKERREVADYLEKEILSELKQLGLKNTNFKIIFKENISNLGLEQIEFHVSFNSNVPLSNLNNVASGGELSRFMLALKLVLAQYISPSIIIFDEIDTGVSGDIARLIAIKCSKISKLVPVIMITHLAVVASYGDNYYVINKENNKIEINNLSNDNDIIVSLVKLINSDINDINIEHAKNMLLSARNDKNLWQE